MKICVKHELQYKVRAQKNILCNQTMFLTSQYYLITPDACIVFKHNDSNPELLSISMVGKRKDKPMMLTANRF